MIVNLTPQDKVVDLARLLPAGGYVFWRYGGRLRSVKVGALSVDRGRSKVVA